MLELVNLAGAADFRLGALEVEPSTRQVRLGARTKTLEPRVMQVLCVLGQAPGTVVSRNTLIARAWGGTVVGDNAINRVISRLRGLADAFGRPFGIETITKVGYRLTVAGAAAAAKGAPPQGTAIPDAPALAQTFSSPPVSRRGMVAGAAAMVAAAAAGAGARWWATRPPVAPASATDTLLARASTMLRHGDYQSWTNVLASLRQAVADDPGHAGAWGLLALAEAMEARNNPPEAIPTAMTRAREAAMCATAINPDNADAAVALAVLVPQSRRWDVAEAAFVKVLERHPDHLWANEYLGRLLHSTGRVREALAQSERVMAIDPGYCPGALSRAERLWGTGRLSEAERAFEALATQWPGSRIGWLIRFSFLALTGRPQDALALSRNAIVFAGERTALVDLSVQSAEALASRDAGLRAAAVEAHLEARRGGAYPSRNAAGFLLALGRPDLALLFLERLVLGPTLTESRVPKSALSHPNTESLFWAPLAPLAGDPRLRAILMRSGLEDYWTRTGMVPDFRR